MATHSEATRNVAAPLVRDEPVELHIGWVLLGGMVSGIIGFLAFAHAVGPVPA